MEVVMTRKLLLIPLAVNYYDPDWNDFLKQLPVIKSTLYVIRWFVVYIPLTVLCAALLFDGISQRRLVRGGVLTAALAALIYINAVKDRDFYGSIRIIEIKPFSG